MSTKLPFEVTITLKPVTGGFIVSYPKWVEGAEYPLQVTEVTTNVGKAARLVKAAASEFSLVAKSKEDDAES